MRIALALAACIATTLITSCATNEITTTYTDAKGQQVKVVSKTNKYDAEVADTALRAAELIVPYIHPDK